MANRGQPLAMDGAPSGRLRGVSTALISISGSPSVTVHGVRRMRRRRWPVRALYADVYGTLLVDGDTRLPITLWEGRDAASLAAWLSEHPGVHIVCRDGSLVYRQGIADGAPEAVQVGDRFHLW